MKLGQALLIFIEPSECNFVTKKFAAHLSNHAAEVLKQVNLFYELNFDLRNDTFKTQYQCIFNFFKHSVVLINHFVSL